MIQPFNLIKRLTLASPIPLTTSSSLRHCTQRHRSLPLSTMSAAWIASSLTTPVPPFSPSSHGQQNSPTLSRSHRASASSSPPHIWHLDRTLSMSKGKWRDRQLTLQTITDSNFSPALSSTRNSLTAPRQVPASCAPSSAVPPQRPSPKHRTTPSRKPRSTSSAKSSARSPTPPTPKSAAGPTAFRNTKSATSNASPNSTRSSPPSPASLSSATPTAAWVSPISSATPAPQPAPLPLKTSQDPGSLRALCVSALLAQPQA